MIRFLADWLLIIVVIIGAVGLLIGTPRGQKIARFKLVVLAGLTALLVARLLGMLPIDQARPFVEKGVQAGASYMNNPGFPSDHTMLAFTLAFACLAVLPARWKKLGWLLIICGILIGVGRVLAGVHTPLDVLGGAFAAAVGALWYFKLKHTDL
ncbi:MAG: phosphatase PAP2 family protein [Candidatus Nomurabacteria bacterium]|jgi:undecaprenyl-diphosphatase|nr:phosphatase PAP2 family protein [Candidatus Nomurabacteria bacterium]